MKYKYIISIDQSTQGTKVLLMDNHGSILNRLYRSHNQIVNEKGWVSHNPNEIYENVIELVGILLEKSKINTSDISGVAISNQRETSLIWDKKTGQPIDNAIVWQCSRATEICKKLSSGDFANKVLRNTGMNLSPYFPASKIRWLLENVKGAKEKNLNNELCFGTIDTWLIFKLTKGTSYKTDISNASRTQLFNIITLKWDEEICNVFGIDSGNLAEVSESNSNFGNTDFEGILDNAIPIHAVLGDSNAALFGQGCLKKGMVKTTYGTGSSIMVNTGDRPYFSNNGLMTSLAWKIDGQINYVLEGNLNYTGAVISWLKDDLELITTPQETEAHAKSAVEDSVYLVPAFTGLGAPYWKSEATASIVGMSRTTKKNEIVRAALECIAYQICDIVNCMLECVEGIDLELRVDGGPTKNQYLMQFQSDIIQSTVRVSKNEELSAIGVAYVAGIALNIFGKEVFDKNDYNTFEPKMSVEKRNKKYKGWQSAVHTVLNNCTE